MFNLVAALPAAVCIHLAVSITLYMCLYIIRPVLEIIVNVSSPNVETWLGHQIAILWYHNYEYIKTQIIFTNNLLLEHENLGTFYQTVSKEGYNLDSSSKT